MQREVERRYVESSGLELRAEAGKKKKLMGYAAMYGVRSVDLGGFVEEIAPGAFDEALAAGADVLARYEHDSRMLLGRVSDGLLRLSSDAKGLRYELDIDPEDDVAKRVARLVERGSVKQSSFAFVVESRDDEDWSRMTEDGKPLRILKRAALIDVAPVASPAYLQTTVSARALEAAKGVLAMKPAKQTAEDFQRALREGYIRHQSEQRAVSYEEKLQKVWMGLCELLGYPWGADATPWYIEATFDDRVILERGYQMLAYPLSWSADGAPVFGEPIQVEAEYVPVDVPAAASAEGASAEARQDPPAAAPDLELERMREELGA